MSKNIILLSNGTGTSRIKRRETNVFKLYEAIDYNRQSSGGQEQIAFYDDGVGNQTLLPLKILGGVFGWGLARNVRDLYLRLCQVYEVGDRIYLFGFSRGAFTVRTLAALIGQYGVLDGARYTTEEELELAVLRLYEDYRTKQTAVLERWLYRPLMERFFQISKKPTPDACLRAEIELIGVWDTVDAVGLPFDEATELWNKLIFRFKFPDRTLNARVKRACHALSIDDERQTFNPLLWDQDPRIEQVWFPGAHANIGGGYPQQGLSLVALDWMMEKARAAGLHFVATDEALVHDRKYALDKLYDSRAGLGLYYRYLPRDISRICADRKVPTASVHISAFERIAQGVFGYAPGNLPGQVEVVDDHGAHPRTAEINQVIAPGSARTPGRSPLLSRAARYVTARRLLYYAFLGYSLFTLYWMFRDEWVGKGALSGLFATLKALVGPESLLDKLAWLLWDNPWLVAIGLLIFIAAHFVWSRMGKLFCHHWHPLRARLRSLI